MAGMGSRSIAGNSVGAGGSRRAQRCGLVRSRGRCGRRSGSTRLLRRRLLIRAFGLQLGRMEDTIASERSDGQRLCIVLEGVRRRLYAGILDRKLLSQLKQYELRVGAIAL